MAKLVPVHSEAEARTVIEQIRRELNDARHHVHAYRIKQDGLSRFSDDGEPHGTAGKPVFDVISGAGLTDVCLVVTRYFGGVLLGTGGLCHAYGAAAKDCMKIIDERCFEGFSDGELDTLKRFYERMIKNLDLEEKQ